MAIPGHIITFYSYKGGTGRSMALANIAWVLASAGRKVLMIDWDLEAPGLHRYFRPFLIDEDLRSSDGLIELADRYANAAIRPTEGSVADDWFEPLTDYSDHLVTIDYREFPQEGRLDLLPAGRQNDEYAVKVNTFDWRNFYNRLGGGGFFEAVKVRARREYDYILIDSRTGVSDTSGICSVQMPDTLVVCFTYNNQSIRGASGEARSAVARRKLLEDEQRTRRLKAPRATIAHSPRAYTVYPVPMRVDYSESDRLELRRAYARTEFDSFVKGQSAAVTYWTDVEVPHHAYYSYEEVLSPFKDNARDPKTVLYSFVSICRRITGNDVADYKGTISPDRQREIRERYADTGITMSSGTAAAPASQETEEQVLVRRADAAMASLSAAEQRLAIRIFLRLVRLGTPGEGAADTAARVPLTEFTDGERVVIITLQNADLLVISAEPADRSPGRPGDVRGLDHAERFVRLADERLVRGWPSLIQWLEADRAFLVWRQFLRGQLAAWEASGRDPGALLRGRLLHEADLWMNRRSDDLSAAEAGYVRASLGIEAPQELVPDAPAEEPGPATAVYLSDSPLHRLPGDVSRVLGDGIDAAIRRDDLRTDVAFGTAVRAALRRCQALVFVAGELSPAQACELAIAASHRASVGGHFRIIPAVAADGSRPALPISVDAPATFDGDMESPRGLDPLTAGTANPRMPYPGTRAFRTEETELYHGPATFIDALVEEVHKAAHVSLGGHPGSGRTSLIQAGLIPRLVAQEPPAKTWKAVTVRAAEDFWGALATALAAPRIRSSTAPGGDGSALAAEWRQGRFDSLLTAVTATLTALPAAERLLLVVDDVTAEAEQRALPTLRAWLERLPVTLLVVGAGGIAVPEPTAGELEDAIVKPAGSLGISSEPAFVAELVADLSRTRYPLPLLQACLARMFDRITTEGLTQRLYAEIGKADRVVEEWAEEAIVSLDRVSVVRALSRLVTVTRDGTIERRPYVAARADSLKGDLRLLAAAGILIRQPEMDGREVFRFANALLPERWTSLTSELQRDVMFLELRQRLEPLVALKHSPTGALANNVGRFTEPERDLLRARETDLSNSEAQYVRDLDTVTAELHRQQRVRTRTLLLTIGATIAILGSIGYAIYRSAGPEPATPDMTLAPGEPLRVRVLDADERPLPNRRVSWQVEGVTSCPPALVATDAEGVAETSAPCPGLKPGTYGMTVVVLPEDAEIRLGDESTDRGSSVLVNLLVR